MSLRDRIGRIWGRGDDSSPKASGEPPATQLGHRRFLSEINAPSPTEAEKNYEPSPTPRKLHKAASTTFQVFSDSLRSRAQAFYVNSSKIEADLSNTPEPKAPKRSPRHSSIWSSVRSRKGRRACGIQPAPEPKPEPELESEPETLPEEELSPTGPAPRLDLHIPSLSLRDSPGDDDVTTPPVTPDRVATRRSIPIPSNVLCSTSQHRQIWPSPHAQLRKLAVTQEGPLAVETPIDTNGQAPPSLAQAAANAEETPVDSNEHAQGNDDPVHILESCATESVAHATIGENNDDTAQDQETQSRDIEDPGYVSDTESNGGTLATEASTARTSISRPPSLVKSLYNSARGFDNISQSSEDFKGTFWPATKVIKSLKRSSRSSTGISSTSITAPPLKGPIDSLAIRSDGAAQSGDVYSEAYEADNEIDAGSPQSASMGPRARWNEARASREKRYLALLSESISMDADTDEDPDFGVELTASPSIPYVLALDDEMNGRIELSCGIDQSAQTGRQSLPTQQDTAMPEPSKSTCQMNGPQHGRAAPIIPIDDYLNDRDLRLRLLKGKADFSLGETWNGQDVSTPETRILVTSQLNPQDSLGARLASFGCRSQVLGNVMPDSHFRPDSHPSDVTATRCTMVTRDSACYVTPPCPGAHATSMPVRQASGLINGVREQLNSRGPGRVYDEAKAKASENRAGTLNGDAWVVELPFRGVLSTIPDATNSPTRQDRCSGLGYTKDRVLSMDNENRVSEKDVSAHISEVSMSETVFAVPPRSSRSLERGRSLSRSLSRVGPLRKARASGQLPSCERHHPYRKVTPSKGYASSSVSAERSATASRASSFSFHSGVDEIYQLEAQIKQLEKRTEEPVPRVRLADVSMVKRREELYQRKSYEALCQFVYRCEAESLAAESSFEEEEEEAEESREESKEDSEVEKTDEEAEAGYTAAMFQGK